MRASAASSHFPCETCQVRDKAICAALDSAELRELNKIVTSVRVDGGGTVFYEGDDSAYLFNVVTGTVRLLKLLPDGRRLIIGFLFAGDFLGLSVAGVYAYSAEAQTATILCRFGRPELLALVDRFPKLEHRLLQLASNELSEAQDQLLLLGRKNSTERVISALLKLAGRIGRKEKDGIRLELPMTRGDLADYTGLTIETVSRTISRLRKEGVIATPDSKSIYIPKPAELEFRTGEY